MKTFREFFNSPRIDTAGPDDLLTIDILESEQTYQKWNSDVLRNALNHPMYETRILKVPGPVGFYITRQESGFSVLNKLVVLETHRGRGYGQAMMNDWIERSDGSLMLQVESDNTPAQNLYLKLGFRKTRVLSKYYENGNDAYEMVKNA
jgi:ribosomal-protein-alanine N-acetyltransferase